MIVDPATLSTFTYQLAAFVGYLGMVVGFYMIFICERKELKLILFGLGTSVLGSSVFAAIQYPWWAKPLGTRNLFVIMTLVIFLFGFFHYTLIVWKCYRLKPPHVRLKELTAKKYAKLKDLINK
jgi:hypothetical protein